MRTKEGNMYSSLYTAAEKPCTARATHCLVSLSITLYSFNEKEHLSHL